MNAVLNRDWGLSTVAGNGTQDAEWGVRNMPDEVLECDPNDLVPEAEVNRARLVSDSAVDDVVAGRLIELGGREGFSEGLEHDCREAGEGAAAVKEDGLAWVVTSRAVEVAGGAVGQSDGQRVHVNPVPGARMC